MYLNRQFHAGNLTKDPELKTFTKRGDGSTGYRCEFQLAISDGYGENAKTNFLRFVAFDKAASSLAKWARKGNCIHVESKQVNDNYTKDGKTVYRESNIVVAWQFAGNKKESSAGEVTARDAFVNNDKPEDAFAAIPDGIEEELPFA